MTFSPVIPVECATYRHFAVSTMSRQQPGPGVSSSTPASMAWPLANLALYVPIYFNEACTIYQVGTGCGATAGGNFDIGLYDMAGNKLQSTGTQVRANTSWNAVDWTDLVVAPGWYYAAMSADGTNNYSGRVPAAGLCEAIGICEQQTAFTLPGTATLTRTTRAAIPTIAFTVRSVAI